MDLMEYQGKDLLRRIGVPTGHVGSVAETPAEAEAQARLADGPVMVKAQVLTGGRGKAGGVKFCANPEDALAAAQRILGMDIKGHAVHQVLVEPASDIAEEYYLSLLHDRVSKGCLAICSASGGMDIEEVNRTAPEKVAKVAIDPRAGMTPDVARGIAQAGGLPPQTHEQAEALLQTLYAGFVANDATLLEINPLVWTPDERLIALDAKVSIDDNALFRHPEFEGIAGPGGDAPSRSLETRAKALGLQYVELDGDVGVAGNGAGLVMATLDVVEQAGGRAANFLDVGGGADADTMSAALSLVLSDPHVKSVLVNIFGGITRCDEVAEGILGALAQLGEAPGAAPEVRSASTGKPLVVRLDGTNAEEGRRILTAANHPDIVPVAKMLEAAGQAVELAR